MRMDTEKVRYAERTYEQYANLYFDRIPYPSPTGIETVLESVAKENPKAKGADPGLFIDPGILRSIEDTGLHQELVRLGREKDDKPAPSSVSLILPSLGSYILYGYYADCRR